MGRLHPSLCQEAQIVPLGAWRKLSILASVLCPAHAKPGPGSAFDLRAPASQYWRNLFGRLDRRVVCLHP
ncbi:MAG: hypothetical protein VXZ35_11415, partial [Pseudomonadota bacterium]|nr:hypothetical protein [Pseudomonadota bacterium]